MKIDEFSFESTAKSVYVMNPSAREQYDSWEDLQSFMVMMAHQYGNKTNSFSTGGYQLTFFKGWDGETNCIASVSAYTAKTWLSEMDYINPDSEESCLNNFNKFLSGDSPPR